ncbi:hypothetical protein FACS1894193_12670 [Bacilli bacterium]|nr:hypothetical protein FACS1894192_11870 [Bacilli bacterium]GHU44358.1 hypothetical protein FACS1894193_12670 [Bacilli bacterium]
MFENYKFEEFNAVGRRELDITFPTKKENLVPIALLSSGFRPEEALEEINLVLSGEKAQGVAGYNDTYVLIHKDISTAYDDLADSDELDDDGEPEIEEVDIPTLRLKEILEDYIAEKEKLGIK